MLWVKHLGEVLDRAAGEDERHVGAQAEQRVEYLGLIHCHDLAGKQAFVSAGSLTCMDPSELHQMDFRELSTCCTQADRLAAEA